MSDKLQELTDKLYNEGLSKGKKEAELLLEKARKESEEIIAKAKEEAEKIIAAAQKEGGELKTKAEGDIKMAATQTLATVKESIENALQLKCIEEPIKNSLSEREFICSIIKRIIEAFNPAEGAKTLELILPQETKEEVEKFIKSSISEKLQSGIKVNVDKNISSGFKVSRRGSGYYIDFTDDSFNKMISTYLRPKTRKLLFGE